MSEGTQKNGEVHTDEEIFAEGSSSVGARDIVHGKQDSEETRKKKEEM